MIRVINRLLVMCLLSIFTASCDLVFNDQVLNKAGSMYLKKSLRETCGEKDPDCIAAVNTQFDSCHSKYEEDWNKYMNSSSSREDELLEIYSRKVYGCILDKDGDPYFVFDPE